MRKSVLHRSSVFSAIILFAVLAFVSCIKDEKVKLVDTTGNLSLIPELFDDGVDYLKGHTKARSKAKNDEDPNIVQGDDVIARSILNENLIETLDIFIKKESDGESTPWIYVKHLDKDQTGIILDPNSPGGLMDKAKQLINKNWANELTLEGTPFDPDIQYHIYVTANNPHTHSCSHTSHNHYSYRVEGSTIPATLADLRELHTYDAKTDCYYTPDEVPARTNRVNHKAFLMDGDIVWSPEPELGEQVWDVDLKRAVSKILVTLGMDPDFKEEISHKANGKNWTSGQPMWRYVHFGFDVADIASGTYELDKDQTGSPYDNKPFKTGALCNTDEVDASQWQWYVKTYTAPFKWSDYTDSPYLLVSVRYTFTPENPEDTLMIGTKIYHYNDQRMCYYRIPICNEQQVADKGLQRNNIYIVDAKIASWGSENEEFEAEDFYLDLEYHVVPWTETNVDHESTIIHLGDINYLTVHPQQYILKGDGAQAVDLNWYASVATDDGRFPDIDVSSLKVSYVNYLGNEVNIKGTVTKEPASPDGLGNIVITSTAPDNNASRGETVQIILTTDGLIKVSSQALLSRAVKTIEFDVELKTTTLPKKHVVIKHFPLDNIQSITGSWSSRWDGVPYSYTETYYTYDLTKYYRKRYYRTTEGWESITQTEWAAGIGTSNDDRRNANSQANAINGYYATGGSQSTQSNTEHGWQTLNSITWNGTTVTINASSSYRSYDVTYSGYDYVASTSIGNRNLTVNLWKYSNYYRGGSTTEYAYDPADPSAYDGWEWVECTQAQYNSSSSDNRKTETAPVTTNYLPDGITEYTVETVTVDGQAGTGSWVDWDAHTGTVWNQGIFTAKVWNDTYCCGMTSANSYTTNNYTNLTNNHMYVIQITSASNEYAVGKPVVDGNYQSQDHVVSPAFMIASQLGAVTRTESPTTAATHCGTYMEVGTDGTRYVGWRLPTKEEINVIIGYQNGIYTHNVTMVEVLGGAYYWTLDGTSANVPTGDQGTATNAYVRCVRDLSLSEISKLNNGE
jgi:hypothetical protein